ncbi:MAG: hypothetical protein HWD58_14920 [Bacteroidota bacterium]|nr:MAG: hypothetical protein HWD58_14920 [Bacteroidota bacterium]
MQFKITTLYEETTYTTSNEVHLRYPGTEDMDDNSTGIIWPPSYFSVPLKAQTAFNSNNIIVVVAAASATNTTIDLRELTKSGTLIQTVTIPGTGANAIRVSGSATSTLYASNSNDGSLFCFTGHNTTNTTSNVNTLQSSKVVVAVGNDAIPSVATTYTGSGTNQTRSATTLNNSNWFIGDQGGYYTNLSTSADPSGNVRSIKAFGGVAYASTASTSNPPVGVISSTTGGSFTGLSGLANGATSRQDFYLISSGSNGNTFDVLYVLDATSATAGTIFKYSLVSGVWTANGTYSTGVGGFSMYAEKSGSGVDAYITTGTGATSANSVRKIVDASGWNVTINATASTIYTAPTGMIIKGIAAAPKCPTVTLGTLTDATCFGSNNGTAVINSTQFNGSYTLNGGDPQILQTTLLHFGISNRFIYG